MLNQVFNEDCLEGMKRIPDKSVDMILCDLPYGTTACKWDTIIPFEHLWKQYERVIKDSGAIVLTASQPFTSALVMSNPKWFKYSWVWKKSRAANGPVARYQPLKYHEDVLVFGKGRTSYYPQGVKETVAVGTQSENSSQVVGGRKREKTYTQTKTGYPSSIQKFKSAGKTIHPTQKPLELFEYLINTYTSVGDTVLDNCMGSGTTAIACLNTGRNYIGFELDCGYYEKLTKRIAAHKLKETEVVD